REGVGAIERLGLGVVVLEPGEAIGLVLFGGQLRQGWLLPRDGPPRQRVHQMDEAAPRLRGVVGIERVFVLVDLLLHEAAGGETHWGAARPDLPTWSSHSGKGVDDLALSLDHGIAAFELLALHGE